MKYDKKIYLNICYVVLGAVLIGCSFAGFIDSFWNGFGSGLVGIGVIQIIRQLRYRSDEEYREKVDIEMNDERNKYIANRAWAWAGCLFVMIMAAGVIVSKILGYDEIMRLASMSVCLLMVLYWVCYFGLRKKY